MVEKDCAEVVVGRGAVQMELCKSCGWQRVPEDVTDGKWKKPALKTEDHDENEHANNLKIENLMKTKRRKGLRSDELRTSRS